MFDRFSRAVERFHLFVTYIYIKCTIDILFFFYSTLLVHFERKIIVFNEYYYILTLNVFYTDSYSVSNVGSWFYYTNVMESDIRSNISYSITTF